MTNEDEELTHIEFIERLLQYYNGKSLTVGGFIQKSVPQAMSEG